MLNDKFPPDYLNDYSEFPAPSASSSVRFNDSRFLTPFSVIFTVIAFCCLITDWTLTSIVLVLSWRQCKEIKLLLINAETLFLATVWLLHVQSLIILSPCLSQWLMSHEINLIPFLTSYFFLLLYSCNSKESCVITALFMTGCKYSFEICGAMILRWWTKDNIGIQLHFMPDFDQGSRFIPYDNIMFHSSLVLPTFISVSIVLIEFRCCRGNGKPHIY